MTDRYSEDSCYLKPSAERLKVGSLPSCKEATPGRDRFGNGIYFCQIEKGKKCVCVTYKSFGESLEIDESKMNDCPNVVKRNMLEEVCSK